MVRHFQIVLLIALVSAGCGDGSPRSREASKKPLQDPESPLAGATTVKTVAPEYRKRAILLQTNGKVQFNEERLVRVNAPLTGRVVEVLARPADVVEPGRRLLMLDSPDLGSVKADYAKAVSDLERSEKALNLARDLFEVKANSEKEIREAENDYRKAVAEKERAVSRLLALGVPEAQLKDVASRTDATTKIVVRAPRGGVIVERNVTTGQVVSFGQSDTPTNLFVIADLSSMWVFADVYEPDVPKVRLGQVFTITPPCCPDERFEGKVTHISDSVDPQTRTVKVRAVVPNRSRMLKAEMFVRVTIDTGSTTVLAIPQSAVHVEEGHTFVLVEKAKDDYERRPVKLGADLDGTIEVLEGITAQDRIVSTGSILLKNSAR